MLKKRGALELQFNWIFVLIVGALIVAFFIVVIQKQLQTSEYETQLTLQTKLNTLMQNAKSSPGTTFVVPLKDELRTLDLCTAGLYINDNRELRIDLDTAFSPDLIKSVRDEIILWVLPWEMPFEATNFVYVTSPDVRYVMVGKENGYADDILNDPRRTSLPEDLTKERVDPDKLQTIFDENNYKVRFVFFVDIPSDNCKNNIEVNSQLKGDITAVCIKPKEGGLDGWGEVQYYKFEDGKLVQNGGLTYYLGRPSLFGAIFAQDKNQFDCVMNQGYKRLAMITELYKRRTDSLALYYSIEEEDSPCYLSGIYDFAFDALEGMSNTLEESVGEDRVKNLYTDAFSSLSSVSSMNYKTSLKSCPTIY